MTTVCEKTIRAALVERYLTSKDEQCDQLLDAVQRLSKYDEKGLTPYIHMLVDYDALRKEADRSAETGDQLSTDRPTQVTHAEATQTMLWLTETLSHVAAEDKPAVERLRQVISESQDVDVAVQASSQDLLYEKLQSSQDKYRKWLQSLPVKDALEHSSEYSTREDILMSVDVIELSEDKAQALLQLEDPMGEIYTYYSKNDPRYMEDIVDAIKGQAQTVLNGPQQSETTQQM